MHTCILMDRGFSDLNPVQCGIETCAPGHAFGPAVRGYYLIHYVLSGCGEFRCGGDMYKVSRGQFFLIRPGEQTFYKASDKDPWEYVWIGFTGKQTACFAHLQTPVGTLPQEIFRELASMIHSGFPKWGSMREEYLVTVIYRIVAALSAQDGSRHYAERAENYLRTSFMEKVSIEQIAQSLSLDRRYLSRLFKKRYGISMREYLLGVRLDNAARLLSDGYGVSEAALMSGFEDRSDFSRAFRRKFGKSPSELKK